MAKFYEIQIWGYGGELVYGRLTKEQFDFWKDNEQMTSHVWDPDEEDTDENPVSDPEDARYIGYWHDQDNIEHFNGADVGNARLEVQEVDSNEWPNKPIGDAIINGLDLEPLLKDHPNTVWDELDLDEHEDDDPLYIFQGMSIEKGTFASGVIELPNDEVFDIKKLSFSVTACPNGDRLVDIISYGTIDFDNMGGDTTGKGSDFQMFEW